MLICSDSEFPLLSRQLVEEEVETLLVPSPINSLVGYHRIRIGAMARALESQQVVLHPLLVGSNPWSSTIGTAQGAAAIYAPPVGFWPETGIRAIGGLSRPGWIIAKIAHCRIIESRQRGTVLASTHWQLSVKISRLRRPVTAHPSLNLNVLSSSSEKNTSYKNSDGEPLILRKDQDGTRLHLQSAAAGDLQIICDVVATVEVATLNLASLFQERCRIIQLLYLSQNPPAP